MSSEEKIEKTKKKWLLTKHCPVLSAVRTFAVNGLSGASGGVAGELLFYPAERLLRGQCPFPGVMAPIRGSFPHILSGFGFYAVLRPVTSQYLDFDEHPYLSGLATGILVEVAKNIVKSTIKKGGKEEFVSSMVTGGPMTGLWYGGLEQYVKTIAQREKLVNPEELTCSWHFVGSCIASTVALAGTRVVHAAFPKQTNFTPKKPIIREIGRFTVDALRTAPRYAMCSVGYVLTKPHWTQLFQKLIP